MAGSSEDPWRRPSGSHADLRDDEPEEGEIVPGYHSDMDTEEYYNRHYSSDSDETISDSNAACSVPESYGDGDATSPFSVAANNNGGNASSSSVAAPVRPACPVCGKGFPSLKAVCGHMKVHREQGVEKDKGIKRSVPVVGSCGGAGERGCSGSRGKAASPNAESEQSMAIVVAEPNIILQPMPLAFATPIQSFAPMASATLNLSSSVPNLSSSVPVASATSNVSSVPVASAMINVSGHSSSAQPMHNDAMDTVETGAGNPPSEAAVNLHAAPPPPTAAGEQSPPVPLQPMAPPPALGRQNPNGYTCTECNLWFRTHQGLGGHVAGHRNREVAAAAAGMLEDGAVACRRNAKPGKAHVCKVCGAVFPVGVQLGGHMRRHYSGPPIVPNKKPRVSIQPPLLPPPALTLALSVNAEEASPAPAVEAAAQPGLAPAVERTPEPAPRPAVAGRVLLFGIDIAAGVKPPAEEGSPAIEGKKYPTGTVSGSEVSCR